MNKRYKILLALMVTLLIVLTYFEAKEPEGLNWFPSYTASDKIPLGSMVVYEHLKKEIDSFERVPIPPYEFLSDSTHSGSYIFLNNAINFQEAEWKQLLEWISEGNTAFLIADQFSQNILDSLQLEMGVSVLTEGLFPKPLLRLTDPRVKVKDSFLFDRRIYQQTFKEFDSLEHTVLGVAYQFGDSTSISEPEPNYLVDSIGKGAIYLNSTPWAFSNYFLLDKENHRYAAQALAYLPRNSPVFWDGYYKSGKAYQSSPLYVLLNKKSLKWAYYFVLLGGLLFLIFEGKRKQRSIPVIPRLQNQSYHFTRTVAGLFLKRKDYKGIASKKIALFLDYIRIQYRVPTDSMDERTFDRLAALNGSSRESIQGLWKYLETLEKKQDIEKDELLLLNKKINAFKNRKNGTKSNG